MDQNPSSSKADRKTIEKNRRIHMKALYSNLSSLVPHDQNHRESISLSDRIEGATNYIKKLQARLEKMKQKKNCILMSRNSSNGGINVVPNFDVRIMGSALEIVLITGQNCQFMFTEVIRMLHEEGAEVVSASFSCVDNTVFHTIHSKIGQDFVAVRICERLRKLVYDAN
ncbi:hypothetical protein CDL12_23074 [Handroanthus impetiginosus]|uniref:BHLH domain-containing protein n=1 Tax=Handroanthus impetiginosus TaxID=429701 RepID=A0A2G9GGH2_9LAMI|nr:hypothetical protein CDL12_23074 [Handroanthus impetiginosus]